MNSEKGAYIYRDIDNDIILFIYLKMTKEELKKALPQTYNEKTAGEENYLIANFKGKQNYMGCGTLENIKRFMDDTDVYNIIESDFEETKKVFNDLTEKQYKNLTAFINKTLSSV